MKKFFLRFLFVLLAFSAIFLAASCSDDSSSSDPRETGQQCVWDLLPQVLVNDYTSKPVIDREVDVGNGAKAKVAYYPIKEDLLHGIGGNYEYIYVAYCTVYNDRVIVKDSSGKESATTIAPISEIVVDDYTEALQLAGYTYTEELHDDSQREDDYGDWRLGFKRNKSGAVRDVYIQNDTESRKSFTGYGSSLENFDTYGVDMVGSSKATTIEVAGQNINGFRGSDDMFIYYCCDKETKTKDGKYAVGDIVFSDGSIISYTPKLSLTDEEIAKAVAVIFKVNGTKAYGVGIKYSDPGLAWCLDTAKGYAKDITDIHSPLSYSDINRTYLFAGDTDGSDNFAQIKAALGTDDDTGTLSNYPAFEFAINYKDKEGSHVKGTQYESGWYLPTVSELYDIYREQTIVNAALVKCGCSEDWFLYYYLSSSQCDGYSNYAYCFDFYSGPRMQEKNETYANVFCIRVFE